MNPIESLISEHVVIERALAALTAIARRLESGAPVHSALALRLLDFLHSYADARHHAKEEEILFPALVARGLSRDVGPVGVMLHEHEMGRDLLRRLRRAAARIDADLEAREELAESAFLYAGLLGDHIRKENFALFPMALRALSPQQIEAMEIEFSAADRVTPSAGPADLEAIEAALRGATAVAS